MSELMLSGARWLKNRGVQLRYTQNGRTATTRFVPPNGRITLPEASRLFNVSRMWFYRLRDRKLIRTRKSGRTEMVALKELRRIAKLGRDRRLTGKNGTVPVR